MINPHIPELWLIFQSEQLLLLSHEGHYHLPTANLLQPYFNFFLHQHALGSFNNYFCYCAELSKDSPLPSECILVPLRKAFECLGDDWYQATVKAFSILNWDKNHQFCGRCGQPTVQRTGLFERICNQCALVVYPRISPSIIVLIKKGPYLLMARSPHFTPGSYGLIAGFVETGESIEQAVHREVQEEVGIEIQHLTYFDSQPWPFPDSLMIGFTADYKAGEITIDAHEIEEANWYHYAHLPGHPSSRVSLAAKLIQHFIQEQSQKQE